jgi:hypothetical protein
MRGVYLEPGKHRVEFRFEPPREALHVSVAAILFTLLVLGVTVATEFNLKSGAISRSTTPSSSREKPKNGTNGNGNGNGNGKSSEPVSNGSEPAEKRKPQSAGKAKR